MSFPGGASGKEPAGLCRRLKRLGFDPWVGKIPGGGHSNHSSILAWRIPWAEECHGWQSTGSQSPTRLKRLSACVHVLLESTKLRNFSISETVQWSNRLRRSGPRGQRTLSWKEKDFEKGRVRNVECFWYERQEPCPLSRTWASLGPSHRWSDFTFSPYDVTSQGLCYPVSLRAPFSPAPQTRFSVRLSLYWSPVPSWGRARCLLSEEMEAWTQTAQLPSAHPQPSARVSPHSSLPWASPLALLSGVSHSMSLSSRLLLFLVFYSLLCLWLCWSHSTSTHCCLIFRGPSELCFPWLITF